MRFSGGRIFTTAGRSRDYHDTRELGVVGHLPGGARKVVRAVEAERPVEQAQLYWACDELAASEARWKRLVKQRCVMETKTIGEDR